MKLLPCPSHGVAWAGKDPYFMLRFPARDRFSYRCSGHPPTQNPLLWLTAQEFQALPDATEEQLQKYGILDRLLRDFAREGWESDQARYDVLLRFGIVPIREPAMTTGA